MCVGGQNAHRGGESGTVSRTAPCPGGAIFGRGCAPAPRLLLALLANEDLTLNLNHTPRETKMNMPGLIKELHEWATEQPRMGEHASNTRFVACHLKSTAIGNKAKLW